MSDKEIEFLLKDGRTALLRSPSEEDAADLLQFIRKACGETEFLLKYPEEYDAFTIEMERDFIRAVNDPQHGVMLTCLVDGKIAGNCQVMFRSGMKERHRASVAVGLLKEYWNLGIGTKMFEEMIRVAREREGVLQMELDFIEGNTRARALYEKMGFRITGVKPDAVRVKDGRLLNAYMMVKKL